MRHDNLTIKIDEDQHFNYTRPEIRRQNMQNSQNSGHILFGTVQYLMHICMQIQGT